MFLVRAAFIFGRQSEPPAVASGYLFVASGYLLIDALRSLPLAVMSGRHKCAEPPGRKRPVKRSEDCLLLLSELGAASDARDTDSWCNETEDLTESEQQTGHLRARVLNVDTKRPRVTSKGGVKGALSASRSGSEVGFPLLLTGIRLA